MSNYGSPTFDSLRPERRHGCAFIVSNRMEDYDQSEIHEAYATKMEDLWKNKIGCELYNGTTYMNIGGRQIKELIKSLSRMDAKEFSYLVVVIIANGGLMESRSGLGDIKIPSGRLDRVWKRVKNRLPTNRTYSPFIYGNDGEMVSEEKILSYFYNANSPWKDKPKFFILGYNRLDEDGLLGRCSETGPRRDVTPPTTTTNSPDGTSNLTHPSISDFILLYATSSKLIDVLYSVFSNNWQTKSVTGLLTMVNNQIRNAAGTGRSLFESSVGQPLSLHHIDSSQVEVENPVLTQVPLEITNIVGQLFPQNRRTPITIDRSQLETRFLHALAKEFNTEEKEQQFLSSIREYRRQDITPTSATIPTSAMRPKPAKGCVLIISNALKRKSKHHQDDIKMMETLWKDTLGCDLHAGRSHANQSAEQIEDLLKDFSEIDTAPYKYAVIVISAHGHLKKKRVGSSRWRSPLRPRVSYSHFFGIDKETINERDMLCLFNRNESPWRGKDKIFILDYCRGTREDPGVPKAMPYESLEEEVRGELIYEPNEDIMPASISTMIEDSFLVYATHAGYLAYSNRLIRAVKVVFEDNWKTKSVAEMLVQVNGRMKTSTLDGKAMSVFKSTSTKDFYLFESE